MKTPIRLGLIGCGGIVQITHARAYRALTDTVQVTALADVVPENLQKVGDLFNVPTENRYTDYHEMLEHTALDVVTIATPPLTSRRTGHRSRKRRCCYYL